MKGDHSELLGKKKKEIKIEEPTVYLKYNKARQY